MMDMCLLIYPMSELRKLEWNGKSDLNENAEMVNMILIQSKKAMEVVQQNRLQIMNSLATAETPSTLCEKCNINGAGDSTVTESEKIQLLTKEVLHNIKDQIHQQK